MFYPYQVSLFLTLQQALNLRELVRVVKLSKVLGLLC